jgi:cytochrome c556
MLKFAAPVAALALGATLSLNVAAQAKPEDLVKQRKAALTMVAKYFGPIGAMVQGKAPYDARIVARNAGYLETLSAMPWDGFDASTESFKETRAKPELYKEKAKFDQMATDMQGALAKLNAAAKGTDQNAVKAAFGDVGKSCKSCHDAYRKD